MKFRKDSVRAVVTGNVATLSGLSPADSDGVTLVADDRILLIGQTDPVENGLWEVATGAWSRPADSASTTNIRSRSIVFVEEGTKYEAAGFVLQTLGSIEVDTDPQEWFCLTKTNLPSGWINVQDFGAVGDATTDNSVAFAAAFQGFPGVYTPGETELDGTLYVPPGTYNLTENLWITRAVRFLGAGGFGEFGSRLKFSPYKGIYVVGYGYSPEAQDAQGAIIESLHIQGGHPPSTAYAFPQHDTWEANYDYEDEKIMEAMPRNWEHADRKYQSADRYFECISPGKSGATEPRWEATVDDLTNGIDDAAVLTAWTASTLYDFNSFVWVPNRFDIVFIPRDFIEEETSGTSSAAMEAAILGADAFDGNIWWTAVSARNYFRGDTIDDPTEAAAADPPQPVWVARKNAGIRVMRRCKIIDCTIRNFLNAGIDLACSHWNPPFGTYSIGTQVMNVQIRQCGGGIRTQFDDSGACLFQAVDIQGSVNYAGEFDVTREFGILDRGQFGSTYIASQFSQIGGPPIFQDQGNSVFINSYTEEDCGLSIFITGDAMLVGGLNNPTEQSLVQGILKHWDWRGVGESVTLENTGNAKANFILADTGHGSAVLGANDESGSFGWVYNKTGLEGSWSLVGDNDPTKSAIRINTVRAKNQSAFMPTFPRGYFVGQDPENEVLVTTGGSTLYDERLRGGRRIVGDRDIDPAAIKPNSFLETVVIESGYRGEPTWPGGGVANTFNHAVREMANDYTVERGGYVYRCCYRGHVHATTEPDWSASTTPHQYPNIEVWNGPYEELGGGRACYKIGDIVRPITPNGFVYMCTDAPVGKSGVMEGSIDPMDPPTWPEALTETVFDGELTWTCHDTETANTYVEDNEAIWVCVGKVPTYGKSNFIHHQGTATLEADVAPVTGVIDLGPLPNDQVNVYRVTVRAQNVTELKYAYWELSATWDATGATAFEGPDVDKTFLSPAIMGDWSAELDIQDGRVVVNIGQDGDQDVTFTAIRSIF